MNGLRRLGVVLASCSALSGCYPGFLSVLSVLGPAEPRKYQVWRKALLSGLPPPTCVESALRSVNGVDSVQYNTDESRYPAMISLTSWDCWLWAGRAEEAHRFVYTVGKTGAEMHLVKRCEDHIRYEQASVLTDSMKQFATIRPVMVQVELALVQQCGISLSEPEEACWSAVCPWRSMGE